MCTETYLYDTRSIENYLGDIIFHAFDIYIQIRDIWDCEEMLFAVITKRFASFTVYARIMYITAANNK
jgi:hypothetical protein